jgi:hypothetical protein
LANGPTLEDSSLHAEVRIHENDREGLERLCRYAVRPPFALHRRSQGPDGNLLYRMKRTRGGSRFLRLTPGQLLTRIATESQSPGGRRLRCRPRSLPLRHPGRATSSSRRSRRR